LFLFFFGGGAKGEPAAAQRRKHRFFSHALLSFLTFDSGLSHLLKARGDSEEHHNLKN